MKLLALAAAAVVAAGPVRHESASKGAVHATASYVKLHKTAWSSWYTRLVVRRHGTKVYDAAVPSYSKHASFKQPGLDPIAVRDLDGDGEPEIVLDFYTGGAHCCDWTRIYRWTGSTYTSSTHWWGDPGYRIVSSKHGVQLLSADDRFAYAFASFAGSAMPVRVWAYHAGRLVDVTQQRLDLVRAEAKRFWKGFLQAQHGGETPGILAGWAADECRLGRGKQALAWIAAHPEAVTSEAGMGLPNVSFTKRLGEFLRRRGYRCS